MTNAQHTPGPWHVEEAKGREDELYYHAIVAGGVELRCLHMGRSRHCQHPPDCRYP